MNVVSRDADGRPRTAGLAKVKWGFRMPPGEGMPDLRLRSYHEVSGALFRKEAGWEVPAGYGALDREVDAVRRDAGILDFSDRAKVRVRGADRVTFLDGLVTADIKTLRPGRSTYALVLDEASRVLGDLRIDALEDAFILNIEAAQVEGLLGYFRKQTVSDDVAMEDLGPCGDLEVHGPRALGVAAVLGVDVERLALGESASFPVDRHRTGTVTRLNTLGERGYAIWAQGDSLAFVWDAMIRVGAVPVGRDALDVLRIEAGRPRFGVDMTPQTLALEVALEGVLSFTKGCYRGQEVVARGTSIGHVNRRLLGLRVDGDVPPSRGDAVKFPEEEVGTVSSGCWSPTTGWVLALALLRVDKVRNDSILFVDHDGWQVHARLEPLPFVAGRE